MIILDCEAQKVGESKLNIIFNINRDFITQEKKYFLLPDDRSKFAKLADEIYEFGTGPPEDIIPSTFNNLSSNSAINAGEAAAQSGKLRFVEQFIDYTLNQNFSYVSITALNAYYDGIFSPSGEEDLAKLALLRQRSRDHATEQLEKMAAAQKEREEIYKQAQIKAEEAQAKFREPPPSELDVIIDPDKKARNNSERPVQDKQLSDREKSQRRASPPDVAAKMDGINGDMLIEAVPVPMQYPGDHHIAGKNNAGLHLTRDEEYRFKGHTGAGACYLYAGRSPNDIKVEEKDGQLGAGTNTILRTPNNLRKDAAYLYLSQKADSRSLLGVVGGTYGRKAGRRKGQSLAAIKADDVVLMARESGIRLITGMDSKNSKGGPLFAQFGVELIAGNDSSDLQPLVKGGNLRKYLRGLSKALDNLSAVTYDFITSQTAFNAVVQNHSHFDPFCILLGTMAAGQPLGVLGGKNLPAPELLTTGTKSLLESLMQMQGTINQVFGQVNNNFNGLENPGAYYINSELNKTN